MANTFGTDILIPAPDPYGLRRCVHSAAFKAEESLFPQLAEAMAFIKRL